MTQRDRDRHTYTQMEGGETEREGGEREREGERDREGE